MFILMMIIVSQISCMQNLCSETMKTHYGITRYRKGRILPQQSEVKEVKAYAENMRNLIMHGERVGLPILAYYGTGRGQIKAPERKRGFQKVF